MKTPNLSPLQFVALAIMIGDTHGKKYEFISGGRSEIVKNFSFEYGEHPGKATIHSGIEKDFVSTPKGVFTDDSQQSLGIMEYMLDADLGGPVEKEKLAQFFIDVYKRDPITGYAGFTQEALEEANTGKELIEKFATKKWKKANGAAMRSIPLGYFPTFGTVIHAAIKNAEISHDDPDAIDSSIGIALAAYGLRTGETSNDRLPEYINQGITQQHNRDLVTLAYETDPIPFFGVEGQADGVPCHGMKTLGAVLHTLQHYDSASEILKQANLLGGDTDSVASLALGLHAIQHQLSDLPQHLYDELSNDPFRRDYVLDVAKKLEEKVKEADAIATPGIIFSN